MEIEPVTIQRLGKPNISGRSGYCLRTAMGPSAPNTRGVWQGVAIRARVTMMLLVNYSSRSVSCTIFHDKNNETCPKPLK
jgi:hypothetical protein